MAHIGAITVDVTVVMDRAAVERVRTELAASLNGVIADPVTVAEVVDRVMSTAPLVRYIAT
jgi:hypothetical protein